VTSVCQRKLKMPWPEIDAVLLAVKTACNVVPLTVASHEKAIEIAKRYRLSFYDAFEPTALQAKKTNPRTIFDGMCI